MKAGLKKHSLKIRLICFKSLKNSETDILAVLLCKGQAHTECQSGLCAHRVVFCE